MSMRLFSMIYYAYLNLDARDFDHKLPMRPGSGPAPKNLPFNTNVSNYKSRYLGDEKKLFKIL